MSVSHLRNFHMCFPTLLKNYYIHINCEILLFKKLVLTIEGPDGKDSCAFKTVENEKFCDIYDQWTKIDLNTMNIDDSVRVRAPLMVKMQKKDSQ